MEQTHRPRGAGSKITTRGTSQTAPCAESPTDTPQTFADAEARGAYALLRELHDHASRYRSGERDRLHDLAELALSSAVVAWWSRWQPLMMHRALAAGASIAEVAAAAGTDEREVYDRWSAWADRQEQLVIGGRVAIDPAEGAAIRARIRPQPPR
ncbi:hypothetical protein ACFP2T_37465 [Plantactinospora solaniradicis]|uniref:DUF222 domain-containing protein n=1 Tax=Plantactinospora solaniradicis TaxID=1723736 RepID=A0ABW1KJ82_9ACTN